jgi:hypothetical protein
MRSHALQPSCSGLHRTGVAVIAYCKDLLPSPSPSNTALQKLVNDLLPSSTTYHISVIIDDMQCAGWCSQTVDPLRLLLSPEQSARLTCHGSSESMTTEEYTAFNAQAMPGYPWTQTRPDTMGSLKRLNDIPCMGYTWILEMDVYFTGNWALLMHAYDEQVHDGKPEGIWYLRLGGMWSPGIRRERCSLMDRALC